MIKNIAAIASGDDVYVTWSVDTMIDECVGFALFRKVDDKPPETVNTWVGFDDEPATNDGTHRPSTQWPIQKTNWVDLLAPRTGKVSYGVTPVIQGEGKTVIPTPATPALWSDPIAMGQTGDSLRSYFTRGTISAQWLSRVVGDKAPAKKLAEVIATIDDPIRNFLGGQARERLVDLLVESASDDKRTIFAALYELNDPQLIDCLKSLGTRASVVLGNSTGGDDGNTRATDDSAALLTAAGVHVTRRKIAPARYAHNKFVVFCNTDGAPEWVWTGSMNWTMNGVCTQNNNGLEIRDETVARDYRAHWERLKDAGNRTPSELVDDNSKPRQYNVGNASVHIWFTPTNDRVDLAEARDLINGATQGVVFLMLNPGPDGLLGPIIERSSPNDGHYDPGLYMRGVLNNFPNDGDSKDAKLSLLTSDGVRQDFQDGDLANVLKPAAIDKTSGWWRKELGAGGKFSIAVHSKVIVIDPASANPIIMTGSHNFSGRASMKNDDNLVIVRGDRSLALSYAVNVLAIYNEYRWRAWQRTPDGQAKLKGIPRSSAWLQNRINTPWLARENKFWLGA